MRRCSPSAFVLSAFSIIAWVVAPHVSASESKALQVAMKVVGDDQSSTTVRQHVVEIEDFQFNPATLTVAIGDTIVFVNRDVVPHTASGVEQSWDSGNLASRQSWSMVVMEDTAGEYLCEYHPNMRGTLRIRRESLPSRAR